MFTDQQIIERVEDALARDPFCEHCGQPTAIVERDRTLWLECSSISAPRSRLESLLRLDVASFHTQHQVVELAAAA